VNARPLVIADLVSPVAKHSPNRIALVDESNRSLTYEHLYKLIQSVEEDFGKAGLPRDRSIALGLPNGPLLCTALTAFGNYAAAAPLNPEATESELFSTLKRLEPQILVALDTQSTACRAAHDLGIPVIKIVPDDQHPGNFLLPPSATLKRAAQTLTAAPPIPADTCLLLQTSGTTSTPKLVTLSPANINATAERVCRTFRLSPQDRCLVFLPMFHIHAICMLWYPTLKSGGSIVSLPALESNKFSHWLERFEPTWYSAVPTLHQQILTQLERQQCSPLQHGLRFIKSQSASLPEQTFGRLWDTFNVPIIESYGMTETASMISTNPLDVTRGAAGCVGAGDERCRIAIMDPKGERLLPAHAVGEVVVQGDSVFSGYLHNAQANSESFSDGWFRTGDLGRLDNAARLHLEGRLKEQINRAGEKFSPLEVDNRLLKHPSVTQAVTFAVPHSIYGEEAAAAVVPKDAENPPTERLLQRYVADYLSHHKIPRRILIVDRLHTGPTGKLIRIGLAQRLGLSFESDAKPADRELDVVERQVAATWCKVLVIDEPKLDQTFLSLGGDSINATKLISALRADLDIDLRLVDFLAADTIAAQANVVRELLLEC